MNTAPIGSTTDASPTARGFALRDRGVLLSTLWTVAILNYLYCDVLAFMDARLLKGYLAGNVNGLIITQGFLLGAAVLMQIPIAMIVLSRVLRFQPNRWANIASGMFMSVIQFTTLLVARPTMYYLFFSIIEISITLFIVWYAWTWRASPTGDARPASLTSA